MIGTIIGARLRTAPEGMIAHRRADGIGILVLAGIALGAVLGVISHSAVSKVMPLAVTAVLALWTVGYSLFQRAKGRRLAAAYERNEVHGARPTG
jgi:hypothetical protein